jgi:hypothetical protein
MLTTILVSGLEEELVESVATDKNITKLYEGAEIMHLFYGDLQSISQLTSQSINQ